MTLSENMYMSLWNPYTLNRPLFMIEISNFSLQSARQESFDAVLFSLDVLALRGTSKTLAGLWMYLGEFLSELVSLVTDFLAIAGSQFLLLNQSLNLLKTSLITSMVALIKQLQLIIRIMMNKYHSLSPSNKGQIHHLLTPIFDLVRKNKIHSYSQLQKKDDPNDQNAETRKGLYIFEPKPKTAQTLYHKDPVQFSVPRERLTHYSMHQKKVVNFQPKTPSVQLQRNKETIETPNAPQNDRRVKRKAQSFAREGNKKMFRVNSKIKKHLVQQIDFDEIEKMFYKKRETITRYQYFLKIRKEQRAQGTKNEVFSPIKAARKQKSKLNIEQKFPLADMTAYDASIHQEWATLQVKSPQRKKFWVKQNSRREVKNSQYPIIQGTALNTLNI